MKYLHIQEILLLFLFSVVVLGASHPEAKLDFEKYCANFKYPVQKYEVTT